VQSKIAYLKAVPRLEDMNGLGILNIPTVRHLPVRHLVLGGAHSFKFGLRFGRVVPQSKAWRRYQLMPATRDANENERET
jgi:hypothetical protein